MKNTNNLEITGTSRQGEFELAYQELTATFGEPTFKTNDIGGKIDVEWIFQTPFGVATIYNYKDGKNYNGEEGLPISDITNWHIGGNNNDVYAYLLGYLRLQ